MSESRHPELEEAKALFQSDPVRFLQEGLQAIRDASNSEPTPDIDTLIADFLAQDTQEEIDIAPLNVYTQALTSILRGKE